MTKKLPLLMKHLTIGNSVIGKFLTPINFVLLLIANMKLFGINLGIWHILTLFWIGLIGSVMIGIGYEYLGFWSYELEYDAERNPILHELRDMRREFRR
jgi:hypothetical protein